LALTARANYICVLVGRMQDQGHDALSLVTNIVKAIDHYNYDAKVMFSSVRHPEHVRNAFYLGAHNITIPWKVMKQLADNNFSKLGTQQFFVHTRLLTMKVKELINGSNPIVREHIKIVDALVKMTEFGSGAVSVVDENNKLTGVFTDGDLRRVLRENGEDVLNMPIGELMTMNPCTIKPGLILQSAVDLFEEKKVDNLIVVEDGCPVGMLDVQDLIKLNLVN
jgi:CBS-domain-containing membrane protein